MATDYSGLLITRRDELVEDSVGFSKTVNRVVRFTLGSSISINKFSIGMYSEVKEETCRFFVMTYDEINLNLCRLSARMSEKVRNPNLVVPVVVERTLNSEYVVMGFTDCEPFVSATCPYAYSTVDVLLDAWWQTNVKDVLEALADSHSKNVYHGRTDSVDSYIIRSGRLCLMMPQVDGSAQNFDHVKHKNADLRGLGSFFKKNARCAVQVDEWNSFTDLFSKPCCSKPNGIKHLINHPVLKSSEKRFHYLRDWLDACFFDWTRDPADTVTFWIEFRQKIPWKLFPFRNAIRPGTTYEKIYMYGAVGGISKYGTDPYFLMNYLLNVVKHLSGDGNRKIKMSVIERDVSTMYPDC